MPSKIVSGTLLILCISIYACFPVKNTVMMERKDLTDSLVISAPTKIHLIDASTILTPDGFIVKNGSLTAWGSRISVSGRPMQFYGIKIPLDSVAAISYAESELTTGRLVGSILLGIAGGIMAPLSVYCLTCPKCCFGSCPTIYTHADSGYVLQAELFSHSIFKQLEDSDVDLLETGITDAGRHHFRLTNEALETHFINQLSLVAVHHTPETEILPTTENSFTSVKSPRPPADAYTRSGRSILDEINSQDGFSYRSDTTLVKNLMNGMYYDWIDLQVDVPKGTRNLKMIMRSRNTLMSTVLFYDVVLASQGIQSLNWMNRMNTDPIYALEFKTIYDAFSGISVLEKQNDTWEHRGTFRDAGPMNWRSSVLEIPVEKPGKVSIRLQFVPDNYFIDYIAFDADTSQATEFEVENLPFTDIEDNLGTLRSDVDPLIKNDDRHYFVTEPGDSYYFHYNTKNTNLPIQTVFLQSKGYYTEWIRGDWLTTKNKNYSFDLFAVDRTLAELAQSWLNNKSTLEREFFRTRIQLKEKP